MSQTYFSQQMREAPMQLHFADRKWENGEIRPLSVPHQLGSEVYFHIRISMTKLQWGCRKKSHRSCSNFVNAPASAQRQVSRPRNLFITFFFWHLPAVMTTGCSAKPPARSHGTDGPVQQGHRYWRCSYKPHTPPASSGQKTSSSALVLALQLCPGQSYQNVFIWTQNDCP